jgi:Kinesin motor domain
MMLRIVAHNMNYDCSLVLLQVYNEEIRDLFVQGSSSSSSNSSANNNGFNSSGSSSTYEPDSNRHEVRLDKRGRVYVEGLVECAVQELQEVEELIALGERNRTVGNNNVNLHSSRSHLVLQVHVTATDSSTGQVQTGRLNLIDLAGSERIKSTAAEGQVSKQTYTLYMHTLCERYT